VQQLMANIQVLIDDGAEVAVRQEIATPSCQQSISYEEALINTIKPLADLKPPELPPTTQTRDLLDATKEPSLSSILLIKQAAWRNLPHLRNSIIAWVQQTEGVVLGENGPDLAHAPVAPVTSSNQEASPTATTLQPAPVFKVGDRVVWVNAPAHWSSWGALTITDIQSGLVLVDCSQIWIPMSELRHVYDDEGVNSG